MRINFNKAAFLLLYLSLISVFAFSQVDKDSIKDGIYVTYLEYASNRPRIYISSNDKLFYTFPAGLQNIKIETADTAANISPFPGLTIIYSKKKLFTRLNMEVFSPTSIKEIYFAILETPLVGRYLMDIIKLKVWEKL